MALEDFLYGILPSMSFYRIVKADYCRHILTPAATLQLDLAPVVYIIRAYEHLIAL